MRLKKTLKSLEELSVDSLSAADAESEKVKLQVKPLPHQTKDPPQPSYPQVPDIRGYQGWGINE